MGKTPPQNDVLWIVFSEVVDILTGYGNPRSLKPHSLCRTTVHMELWDPQTHSEGALTLPHFIHSLKQHVL